MVSGFGLLEVTLTELFLKRSGSKSKLEAVKSEWGGKEWTCRVKQLFKEVWPSWRGEGLRPVAAEEKKVEFVFCFVF